MLRVNSSDGLMRKYFNIITQKMKMLTIPRAKYNIVSTVKQ